MSATVSKLQDQLERSLLKENQVRIVEDETTGKRTTQVNNGNVKRSVKQAVRLLGVTWLLFVVFIYGTTSLVSAQSLGLQPIQEVNHVVGGGPFTCAIFVDNQVKCWGSNSYGQLGNGATEYKNLPTTVGGLGEGVLLLAAGGNHTCAVTTNRFVKCWGHNNKYQLGNGTNQDSSVPIAISNTISNVQSIDASYDHTCVVTLSGVVYCWGDNSSGQLGNGSTQPTNVPVSVTGLISDAVGIATGDRHTCALLIGGGVKCWGMNLSGEVGNGSGGIILTPVNVTGLSQGVKAIAAGNGHTCALTIQNEVKCWGKNHFGQLGNSSAAGYSLIPVDVIGLGSDVIALAAGELHTCALLSSGKVKCWGRNYGGQLGDGTDIDNTTPVEVINSGAMTAIAGGWNHTCAMTNQGGLKCWGSNFSGELGDGTFTSRSILADVLEVRAVTITLKSNGVGAPGSHFLFTGSNFQPAIQLPVYLSQITQSVSAAVNSPIGAVTTSVSGSFTLTIATDAGMASGTYQLAVGESGQATAEFTVDPSAPILPPTSSESMVVAIVSTHQIYLPLIARQNQISNAPIGWQIVLTPTQVLRAIDMVSESDGWAIGNEGLIMHWNGASWSNVNSPTTNNLLGVQMISANDGWIVGTGVILRWDGSNWNQVTSPVDTTLYAVEMVSANDGWAVGISGTIVRWNGANWLQVTSPITAPAVSFRDIAMVSSTDGWIVGGALNNFPGTRVILRWDGSTWQVHTNQTAFRLLTVSLPNPTFGFAAGSSGEITKWDGASWSVVTSPTQNEFESVTSLSSSAAWGVAVNGGIYRWDGIAWKSDGSPTPKALYGIDMVSTDKGWAVGDGVILRYQP